ncbi:DNA polymerase III subunit beta [Roseovarius indicus]|uniref:Beta sliding clamp n=1 Tax=Roseovarius indicus TaxID=540747 RepID=A0A0T5P8E6_9RHOB|nr:DNA polymerase III subunit beta [Roseovarius indicus]KRS17515.1 hypothetical protein XM52_13615 [Roseovarius indicus]QEW26718.1 DNA polymerase III subunit beta [Roseovarius indicus]SFD61147.1 DNA polymerase III sliding clamp (beta) subunit, PCNA homolog [Roseovarius indicus]
MRFQVEAPQIRAAVEAASIPLRRGHVPILDCLHVIADGGRLRFIGTNMDVEAQATCEASVSDEGSCNVNAADLARVVKSSSGVISAHVDDIYLRLESAGSNVALPALDQEFPRLKKPEDHEEIEDAERAFRGLTPFMLKDEHNAMGGVCLDEGNAVATTGKRLARFGITGGKGQVIPGAAIPAICKAMKPGARLFVGERTWRVEAENMALAGKLVEAKFPPWRRIVIERSPICSFDADEMLVAIDRATIGQARDLFVQVAGGTATLTGEKWPAQHIDAKATIRCDDGDIDFVCLTSDLIECIKPFSGSVVDISATPNAYRFSASERPDDFTMMGAVTDHRNRLPQATEATA